MLAGPPLVLMVPTFCSDLPPSPEKRTTVISFSTMHCTSSVLLLEDQATPWHHLPMDSSPDLVSCVPLRLQTWSRLLGLKKGEVERLVGAVDDDDGDKLAVRRHLDGLGRRAHRVGIDDARRGELEVDDADGIGIAGAGAAIGDDGNLALGGDIDPIGAMPAAISRWLTSTLVPSMART